MLEIRAEVNCSPRTYRQRNGDPRIKPVALKESVEPSQEVRELFIRGHPEEMKTCRAMATRARRTQPRLSMILPRSKLRRKPISRGGIPYLGSKLEHRRPIHPLETTPRPPPSSNPLPAICANPACKNRFPWPQLVLEMIIRAPRSMSVDSLEKAPTYAQYHCL